MRLVSSWREDNDHCCEAMGRMLASLDHSELDPSTGRSIKIGLYSSCDAFTLVARDADASGDPVLGGHVGERDLTECPWCSEAIIDCFAGSDCDNGPFSVCIDSGAPLKLDLSGTTAIRLSRQESPACLPCAKGVDDPALFKATCGTNRMQLCLRHHDAWCDAGGRTITPMGRSDRNVRLEIKTLGLKRKRSRPDKDAS